jgi:hypothetical protein
VIHRALGLLLAAAAGAGIAAAPRGFRFEPGAQAELRRLWSDSRASGMERVACLAGVMDDDSVRVTGVRPLRGWADSLMISAQESLEQCHPPEWLGTVHTHIALQADGQPFDRFSGSDRGVMLMWWQRWRTDGTFCLLFAQDRVHCEIDGSGLVILPSGSY